MSRSRSLLAPKPITKQEQKDHQRFAERSQLLRWFHERQPNELKAMRRGFELMLQRQSGVGGKP
jgi:hypothetical protein